MTKTQEKLLARLMVSNAMYRDLKTGVNRRYITLSNLTEINQGIKLAEKYPDKFEINSQGWRYTDLICKTN